MTKRSLVLGLSICVLLVAISPAFPVTPSPAVESLLTLAGDLQHFAALSQSPLHARLFENARIYAELLHVYDTTTAALIESGNTSPVELQPLLDRIGDRRDESALDLLDRLKRRSFAANDAAITERVERLVGEATTWRGSYLEYLKGLGPTVEQLQASDAPGDAKNLLISNGFLLGGLNSAIGDALTSLKKYREAIVYKQKAWDALKPAAPREFRFASDVALDLSLLHYILSDPNTTVETDLSVSLDWMERSLEAYRKSDGAAALLAYRLQFRLRLMSETGCFSRVVETIEEADKIGAFADLTAMNGLLCLVKSGLFQTNRDWLDRLAKRLEAVAKDGSSTFGATVGLSIYHRVLENLDKYKEYLKKAKDLLGELKPASDLEKRSIKLYESELKDSAQDQQAMLNQIKILCNSYKFKEALELCNKFILLYPDNDNILYNYLYCVRYGVVKPELELNFKFPQWNFSDPSFIEFQSSIKDELEKCFIRYNKWLNGIPPGQSNGSTATQFLDEMSLLSANCYRLEESIDTSNRLLMYAGVNFNIWRVYHRIAKCYTFISIRNYIITNDFSKFQEDLNKAILIKKDWADNHSEQTSKFDRATGAFSLSSDYMMIKDYDSAIIYLNKYCTDTNYFYYLVGYAYSYVGQCLYEKANTIVSLDNLKKSDALYSQAEEQFKKSEDYAYGYNPVTVLFKPLASLGHVKCLLAQNKFTETVSSSDVFLAWQFSYDNINDAYKHFYDIWVKYFRLAVSIKKASAQRFSGKCKDAIDTLNQLLTAYPDDQSAVTSSVPNLVFMFNSIGDFYQKAEPIKTADDFINTYFPKEISPLQPLFSIRFTNYQKPDIFYQLGLCYLDLKDYKNAETNFKLAAASRADSKTPLDIMYPGLDPDFIPFAPGAGKESAERAQAMLDPNALAYAELYLDKVSSENKLSNGGTTNLSANSVHKILVMAYNISGTLISDNYYAVSRQIEPTKLPVKVNDDLSIVTNIEGEFRYIITVTPIPSKPGVTAKIFNHKFGIINYSIELDTLWFDPTLNKNLKYHECVISVKNASSGSPTNPLYLEIKNKSGELVKKIFQDLPAKEINKHSDNYSIRNDVITFNWDGRTQQDEVFATSEGNPYSIYIITDSLNYNNKATAVAHVSITRPILMGQNTGNFLSNENETWFKAYIPMNEGGDMFYTVTNNSEVKGAFAKASFYYHDMVTPISIDHENSELKIGEYGDVFIRISRTEITEQYGKLRFTSKGIAEKKVWIGNYWPVSGNNSLYAKDGPLSKYDKVFISSETDNSQAWELNHHGTATNPWDGHCGGASICSIVREFPSNHVIDSTEFLPKDVQGLYSELLAHENHIWNNDCSYAGAYWAKALKGNNESERNIDSFCDDFHNSIMKGLKLNNYLLFGNIRMPNDEEIHTVSNHLIYQYDSEFFQDSNANLQTVRIFTTLRSAEFNTEPSDVFNTRFDDYEYILCYKDSGDLVSYSGSLFKPDEQDWIYSKHLVPGSILSIKNAIYKANNEFITINNVSTIEK